MTLVSNFELLLKPQLPASVTAAIPSLAPLQRVILQGYFLTISNHSGSDLDLILRFTTKTPQLNTAQVLGFYDSGNGGNVSVPVANVNAFGGNGRAEIDYELRLERADTALFILQPDVTDSSLLSAADFESRGFVELFSVERSRLITPEVLVSAEHRGTFFAPSSREPSSLGEVAYGLPIAGGSPLLKLNPPFPN